MEKELYEMLVDFPDSYDSFVDGTMSYARKKPERMIKIIDYIKNNKDLTSSDVVLFIINQPDFYEDSAVNRAMVS